MIARILASLHELDEFVRLHQLGFVGIWPLLGLASVADFSLGHVAGVLVVALFFNTYGVVLDDAVHLDVDRHDPLRANQWLVRGVLTKRQALVVAWLELPLMLLAHIGFGFSSDALPYLLGAIVGQGVYDLYGKRCPVPPLMEVAEAAAAFCLVGYGGAVTGVAQTPLVWVTAGAGAAFILFVNAFHGSLRDIEVEIGSRQRTTPIWLGCRGVEAGVVHISPVMSLYGAICQAALIGFSVGAALLIARGQDAAFELAGVLIASLAHVILFVSLHWVRKPVWDCLMRFHVAILVVPMILAFAPALSASANAVVCLVYFGPMVLTASWWLRRAPIAAPTRTAPDATSFPSRL